MDEITEEQSIGLNLASKTENNSSISLAVSVRVKTAVDTDLCPFGIRQLLQTGNVIGYFDILPPVFSNPVSLVYICQRRVKLLMCPCLRHCLFK